MGTIAPPGLIAVQPQLGENGGAPGPSGQTILQARGDTAYTTEWDSAEQAALDSALARFPADRHPPLERYVRAAACLPKKNVRDVALRVAWLRATAAARKRKMADEANSKKQVRRERGQSIFAVQPKPMGGAGVGNPMASSVGLGMAAMPGPNMAMASGMPMPAPIVVQPHGMAYAQPVVPLAPMPQLDDHGAGTVGGVGGPLAQLLEQNYAILNQFKQNMAAYKVNENTELLVRFRDNILTVLNHMNSMQGVMQQMPPLPVRLNVELANNFLPKAVANGMCQFSYVPPPGGMSSGPMLGQQGSSAGMAAPSVPTSAPVAALPPREEPAAAAPEAPPVKMPPVEQPSMPVLANGAVSSEAPTAVPAPSQPSQSDVPAANPCVTSSPKAGIGTRSSSAAQLSPSRPKPKCISWYHRWSR
ncbi:hypothetical protein WJX75_009873 [Coccomyxa subellipsoidea]|uniref:Myb-like domain-containing protein n=1 Tax=Coccomyxa subellipsoidea TaxID=248742 RepID=A0ABR2YRP9_9CHLO